MSQAVMQVYRKAVVLSVVLTIFSGLIYFVDLKAFLYRASVLNLPEHAAFDGTVYPIELVPNYAKLTEAERKMKYGELPSDKLVSIPYYDPNVLVKSTDGLSWTDSEANKIRNAKITYSVPYMGNYKMDGLEHGGSHAAVDIKIPYDTPILAMANGVVTKVSRLNSGFGYHIVVQHNGVPSLDDASARVTLHSSYSHLGDTLVSVGDIVKKGQRIGLSGKTGTATTPHLHFQLDTDSAPWHPFWPFTWQEASDAGLDFFSAINSGLGKEKAVETTVNPMKYVQKYLDEDAVTDYVVEVSEKSEEVTSYVEDITSELETRELEEAEEVVEIVEVAEPVAVERVMEVRFDIDQQYEQDENAEFVVYLTDQFGERFPSSFSGEMLLKSKSGNFTASPALLSVSDFDGEGVLRGELKSLKSGTDRLVAVIGDKEFESPKFAISAGEGGGFSDVLPASRFYKSIGSLRAQGIIKGYDDGSYKPSKTLSKVEAAKFIVLAAKLELMSAPTDYPFPDADLGAWYPDYVYTLYKEGVITGTDKGKLEPNKEVNQAEFFKMLLAALDVEVEVAGSGPWYGPYMDKVVKMGIIARDEVSPGEAMSRGEVAEAIYQLLDK
ncbi:peptidoglycan DD-metalloendopeptidase family protein [Candidatus Gracilibacteria bacterium]|nr:peptidoglycan DD-metalloendopeptidase family protein [Candidatus Gracilibacteria bacterium]